MAYKLGRRENRDLPQLQRHESSKRLHGCRVATRARVKALLQVQERTKIWSRTASFLEDGSPNDDKRFQQTARALSVIVTDLCDGRRRLTDKTRFFGAFRQCETFGIF